MAKVLLAEDDGRIAQFIRRGLEAEGYVVDVAGDGRDALALAQNSEYAIIILDRMLPGLDGLTLCQSLRKDGCASLVLMLTAKDSLQDKLDGLNGGADDYLTKPFAFDELIARMQALLRRGHSSPATGVLRVGDLVLNPADRSVKRGQRQIVLTAKEYALLSYLMSNAGQVISRSRLLNNVWSYNFEPGTKILDVYIRYLRKKIDDGEEHPLIHTMRGFGYRMAEEPPRTEARDSGTP
ncbi:MAG: response regulator transcription factor [Pseudomonadota bacterium]|nr:response regulator transcription factor [Pseudomonadota bacterium]